MREETYCGKEEIYVSSCSVIELDCPSPDGSDSGIYNSSTDTGLPEQYSNIVFCQFVFLTLIPKMVVDGFIDDQIFTAAQSLSLPYSYGGGGAQNVHLYITRDLMNHCHQFFLLWLMCKIIYFLITFSRAILFSLYSGILLLLLLLDTLCLHPSKTSDSQAPVNIFFNIKH